MPSIESLEQICLCVTVNAPDRARERVPGTFCNGPPTRRRKGFLLSTSNSDRVALCAQGCGGLGGGNVNCCPKVHCRSSGWKYQSGCETDQRPPKDPLCTYRVNPQRSGFHRPTLVPSFITRQALYFRVLPIQAQRHSDPILKVHRSDDNQVVRCPKSQLSPVRSGMEVSRFVSML